MTDVEIEKALVLCGYRTSAECKDCPIDQQHKDECQCGTILVKNALAYIERLKEKIAEAKKLCKKKVGELKTNEWIKIMTLAGYEVNAVEDKKLIEQIRNDTAKEIINSLLSECDASPDDCVDPY